MLDPALQKNLESVMQELALEYPKQAKKELEKLNSFFEKAKTNNLGQQFMMQNVFPIAHDLKGQGATFDYPLITLVGNKICRYIEKQTKWDSATQQQLKIYIDFLNEILENKLTQNGGKRGKAIQEYIEKDKHV